MIDTDILSTDVAGCGFDFDWMGNVSMRKSESYLCRCVVDKHSEPLLCSQPPIHDRGGCRVPQDLT